MNADYDYIRWDRERDIQHSFGRKIRSIYGREKHELKDWRGRVYYVNLSDGVGLGLENKLNSRRWKGRRKRFHIQALEIRIYYEYSAGISTALVSHASFCARGLPV